MTKITHKAFNRKFESDMFGRAIRREKSIEPERKILGECSICFKPIYVSAGQFIKSDEDGGFSHKRCREVKKYSWQI